MDKYEYKVKADEIKDLIASGSYAQAADIADTIDWRRVKSVMMLCTISDLYKINRRYEDAKNMLLLAYDRRPGGKTVCYSLCELCLKTEDIDQARRYFKEYVQAAPKDPGRYILQYKFCEAIDVSLEERISVLEELKKRDYREKWAYELAYLYHRVGLATRCVEECDEMILWFGEGKYVIKAMELKMLHQPLTPEQQDRYDRRFEPPVPPTEKSVSADVQEQAYTEEQIYSEEQSYVPEGEVALADNEAAAMQGDTIVYEGIRRSEQNQPESSTAEEQEPVALPEELDIQVKTMDMGKYNTINLQAELAAGLREVLGDDNSRSEAITRSIVAPMIDTETLDYLEIEDEDIDENDVDNGVETIESSEVFFGETGELGSLQPGSVMEEMSEEPEAVVPEIVPELGGEAEVILPEIVPELDEETEVILPETVPEFDGETEVILPETVPEFDSETEVILPEEDEEVEAFEEAEEQGPVTDEEQEPELAEVTEIVSPEEPVEPVSEEEETVQDTTADTVMNQLRMESIVKAEEQARIAQPPRELASVLSQESDGQISLVMPERETVEKQITGQLSIQDILSEWERMKKEGEERRKEEVRQRVLQQTGSMFTEFEASVRDGLLEQLENGTAEDEPAQEQEDLDIAVEEEGTPEEVFEDEIPEDEIFEDEIPEDKILEDEIPEDEIFEDEIPEDEVFEDEIPEEEISEEVFDQEEASDFEEYSETDDAENPEGEDENEDEIDFFAKGVTEEEESVSETVSEEDGPEEPETAEYPEEDDLGEVEELEEIQEEPVAEEPIQETAQEVFIKEDIAEKVSEREAPEGEPSEEGVFSKDTNTGGAPWQEKTEDSSSVERDKAKVRQLTREEKELFGPYVQSKAAREQLVEAIDNISMASYTGNVIVTGDEGMDTSTLAMNMIREVQNNDSNFSGKVAKITGQTLNKKDVSATLQQLKNGALIIQKASGMSRETATTLHRELQGESLGIIVVMEDTKKAMNKMLAGNKQLGTSFTARFELQALSNDLLVEFAKQYAKDMEYSIDDLGVLALHTRIDEMQTIDHAVTVSDVKGIVDGAIRHSGRKTLGHFVDILLAKRYDEEDMVILTEKDFA